VPGRIKVMSQQETIIITGGTGLVGRHLSVKLSEKGYRVILLSTQRSYSSSFPVCYWDVQRGIVDKKAVSEASFIIHLAGAGIGKKLWSDRRKQEILDSRVKGAQLIFNTIKENKTNLKAFISASASGYYGTITTEKIFAEDDPPADDYTGRVCREWEEAADSFKSLGIRTVKIRTGIVLAKDGGALAGMLIPLKFGLNLIPGKGDQYLPWIHIDDLSEIYIRAVEDAAMSGAWNAAAPDFITMNQCMGVIARIRYKSRLQLHVPAFAIRLARGEMANLLLKGSRVSADKLLKEGFKFVFPSHTKALEHLLTDPFR
jgi:uncharacterized protein